MRFKDKLHSLGFATYAEYLASDGWYAFKKRYKGAGLRMTCQVCAAKPIQLHHQTYVRLGNEQLGDVIPLCREHHGAVHEWLKASGRIFVEYTHEAVAALGAVDAVTRPPFVGKKKKDRKAKKKKNNGIRLDWGLPKTVTDESAALADVIRSSFTLTKKQKNFVWRLTAANDIVQLQSFLIESTAAEQARVERETRRKEAAEAEKIAAERREERAAKRRAQKAASPPVPRRATGDLRSWKAFIQNRREGTQSA